jgi:hypothetical protein
MVDLPDAVVSFVLKCVPMRSAVIVLVGWLVLATVASSQISEAEAPALMQDLAKKHQAWNAKLNSPGVSIKLREVGRASPKIFYKMEATGFPPGLKYTLVTWPANRLAPQQWITDLWLDASGRVTRPSGQVRLQFSPVKSEPVRLALVSDDDKHLRAVVNFVPIPNRATDKSCSVETVMLAPNSSLVAIQGTGFKPNASVTFLSESEGEHHDSQIKADADGNLYFAMGEGVKGKEKGTTKINVVSPECSVSLSSRWGKDSYEYQ